VPCDTRSLQSVPFQLHSHFFFLIFALDFLCPRTQTFGTQVRSLLHLQNFFSLSRYHYCIAVENLRWVVVIEEVSRFESLGFAVRVILGLLRVSITDMVENSEWL